LSRVLSIVTSCHPFFAIAYTCPYRLSCQSCHAMSCSAVARGYYCACEIARGMPWEAMRLSIGYEFFLFSGGDERSRWVYVCRWFVRLVNESDCISAQASFPSSYAVYVPGTSLPISTCEVECSVQNVNSLACVSAYIAHTCTRPISHRTHIHTTQVHPTTHNPAASNPHYTFPTQRILFPETPCRNATVVHSHSSISMVDRIQYVSQNSLKCVRSSLLT
jgi:hypothetical protein